VLSGQVVPSGKLPIEMPRLASAERPSYLAAPLAGRTQVSSVDPTPLFAFGHGLSYTTFAYSDLSVHAVHAVHAAPEGDAGPGDRARIGTDGTAEISCTVLGSIWWIPVPRILPEAPILHGNRGYSVLLGIKQGAGEKRQATAALY
jgi:hypothetical protein